MILNATNSVLLQTMFLLMQDTETIKELQPAKNNTSGPCYGVYGCYEMSHPWTDDLLRPVNFIPQSPEDLKPRFCLYTRHNENRCQFLDIEDTDSLYKSFLEPDHRVYFISHGFLESGNKRWIHEMKHELLKMSDCIVVVVDWSGGSGPPYPQAVANIRVVGTMTAHLLRNMIVLAGVRPELIHFIGHSLGAHMAAYAGQTLQKVFNYKLGRISGLDPAQPHFTGTDPIVRLDPTDADFVDVIHTDAGHFIHGGLGILHPVGHVDFYPNGGVQQPGCDTGVISYSEMSSFFQGFRRMLSCNHIRSYQYFIESINPGPCYFMGTECSSWEEFKNGSCFDCSTENRCPFQNRMGLHADSYIRKGAAYGSPLKLPPPRTHVKLYMMTGPEGPFCRHHYQIVFKISDSCKSLLHGGEVGMIWITLQGDKETSREIKLSEVVQYYEPGNTYQTTVAGDPVGKLQSVTLRWEYHTSPWNPLTWRLITTPRIYIDWMKITSVEEKHRITICPEEGKPLTSRKTLSLERTPDTQVCIQDSPRRKLSECVETTH